jgi:uncharacterized membrane protein YkgB
MTLDRIDRRVVSVLRRYSVPALRISLSIVFLWFGALKVFGVSPVADLVASTVYWLEPEQVVMALGVLELAVGVGLLLRVALRLVLLALVAQLIGTFLVLVIQPGIAFQNGNPLLLTVEGEFVVKNLVLITAGLVVGSTVRAASRS